MKLDAQKVNKVLTTAAHGTHKHGNDTQQYNTARCCPWFGFHEDKVCVLIWSDGRVCCLVRQ